MAATSTTSLPVSTPPRIPSPPKSRLGKVLAAGRRRSSDVQSESGAAVIRASIENLGLVKSPSISSQRSPSRDGSIKSGSSSVKKLIPGHQKRERQRQREEELNKIVQEDTIRGRQPASTPDPLRPQMTRSRSSLMTVDSELDSPPSLSSRDSHSGYLTTSSPLIKTTTVDGSSDQNSMTYNQNGSMEQFPSIVEPLSAEPSPKTSVAQGSPSPSPLLGLMDKADTLKPMVDPSRARGKSPARKFKDVFTRSGKSPRVSPERPDRRDTAPASTEDLTPPNSGFRQRRLSNNPEARNPSPLRAQTIAVESPKLTPTVKVPSTPPANIFEGPTTTVTPPTPVDPDTKNNLTASPAQIEDNRTPAEQAAAAVQTVASTPGHRRVRSAGGAIGHTRSKLSTSIIPPLTPTIEEMRTPGTPNSRNTSAGGGFFSSWMTAAQNAATSITSLTNQNNRSRSGTTGTDPSRVKEEPQEQVEPKEASEPQKPLAVSTLGSGDLNLSHLGIEAAGRTTSPARSEYGTSVKTSDASAKYEDILTKRAVSQAYEQSRSGEATPVAELPDPVSARPASTFDHATGTLTPPNGSIFEGEGGMKRTNSVRSKLHNRRSRGSSVTTAQSAMGAMIGASTATLANPVAPAKLSGFVIASKQRNRAFHQQFRSVPEDDFLIEDYSCALQKEILLAGRIYISEGHICFSSNILGWVTTLIISFEEVVSIEKENTAIVIPNAIAVQTLHARHTFRSLLGREATYDLMIGIWRVSHPDSFQKSVNGKKLAAGVSSNENVTATEEVEPRSSEEDSEEESGSEEDDDEHSIGSSGSMAGSEFIPPKPLSRKPSGGAVIASAIPATADATSTVAQVVSAVDGAQDFPGPATHPPTECPDASTHYDKIIKDEIIQAPLGKVYNLLYGPQSSTFVRKFLLDGVSKAQDLQLEEDKTGLNNEVKSRKYQYIKPLGGSIGPKQTTTITTENMDSFDLDRAVSVTCTTQTPDVPSGGAFSVKTRYCLTWAPGNATRFQMNMTIEWTAKSWLKGPIENGALGGQREYGDDLVKTIKSALGRTRAATTGSKVAKNGKKKRKVSKKDKGEVTRSAATTKEDWGALDFLRPTLSPVVDPIKPLLSTNVLFTILTVMVVWMWVRTPTSSSLSRTGAFGSHAIYEDLWQREETELWDWLQHRAGVDGSIIRDSIRDQSLANKDAKHRSRERKKLLQSKNVQARLREEKKSTKEMEEAIRVTQERLDALQKSLHQQKAGQ